MKKIVNEKMVGILKNAIQKQIDDTVKGKCIFLCYQPQIPSRIREMQKRNSIK